MSTATSGRAREHRVRDHLIRNGWTYIMRAAGSKGPADLLLAHLEHGPALVQVGTASKRLGPADRARFLHAAELCNALPLLATVHPGQGITYWVVNHGTAGTWHPYRPGDDL